MPKCSNCGAELDAGAKFCMECGTPIPQVKKCVQCGTELPLKAKFCFGCGAPQESAAAQMTGVSMGDKNVVAGDVIGQKIAGDNVQNKVMGNAFFSTVQDDTKRVNFCHVCGKHLTNDNGHTCPGCGNIVCEEHFDTKVNMCLLCAAKEKERNTTKYKEALKEALADGVIDFNERAMLKKLQVQLGVGDKEADLWEQAAKSSRMQSVETLTTIENINIKKAEELFYENGDAVTAYQLVEPIYRTHPLDETLLNIYLPILVYYNVDEAKETIQSIKVDCLALCIAEIEVALLENCLDVVEKKIQQGKTLWPNNERLKYYEALLYVRLAFESSEWEFIQEAKRISESFAKTDDKIERTLQARLRKTLAALDGERVEDLVDNQQNLYTALYENNIGITKILVGPERKIKSIQQAIDLIDWGGVINVEGGLYDEILVINKCVSIVGVANDDKKPTIQYNFGKSDIGVEVKTSASIKNLSISGISNVEHNQLSFENGRYYAAIRITSSAVLENVTVENSVDDGIVVEGANANPRIVRCCMKNNHGCGTVLKNAKAIVEKCDIYGNRQDGVLEKESSSGTYSDCDICDNVLNGVRIQDSASGSFRNCKVHDNKGNGFNIKGESAPKIENCKIHDNKINGAFYSGVEVLEKSRPTLTGCEIYGHLNSGIWEKHNASGTYSDCDIHDNNVNGVDVQDSASGTFRNCSVHDNKGNGFNIKGESAPKIENCKIHDNKTNGTFYPGVVAQEKSRPTVFGCEIYGHLSYGIWEKDNACGTYSGCNIHDNTATEIYRVKNEKEMTTEEALKALELMFPPNSLRNLL